MGGGMVSMLKCSEEARVMRAADQAKGGEQEEGKGACLGGTVGAPGF
jgi:hypothetical protein